MEYIIFIEKLYIKGVGITKAEFAKKLFMSSVNNTSNITKKRNSDSVYKGYNRGNPINEIAYDVVNNLNQSGIETCIEEYLDKMQDKKSENAQMICSNFIKDISDINPENISERIASFFVDEVLKPAAKEYENRIASTEPITFKEVTSPVQKAENAEISVDNHSVGNSVKITNISTNEYNIPRPTIKKRHAEKIDDIIDKIIELIKNMVYYYDSDKEKETFQQNYSNYFELNSDLCGYALIYPFIESIQKIPEYLLKETDFFFFEDSKPYLVNYEKYKKLLLDIRKEITALDEE